MSWLMKKHLKSIETYFDNDSKFWNLVYQGSEKIFPFTKYEMDFRKSLVLQCLAGSEKKAATILDCGCGSGEYVKELKESIFPASNVIGLDISSKQLHNAQTRIPGGDVLFVQGDVENTPFRDGTFDAIYSVGVLQYLTADHGCLEELKRALKDDGVLVVTFPNIVRLSSLFDPYYYIVRLPAYLRAKVMRIRQKGQDINDSDYGTNTGFLNRRYLLSHVKKLMKTHGFEIDSVYSVSFGPFAFWQRSVFPERVSIKLSGWLSSLSRYRLLSGLNHFTNRWVIAGRKAQ